MRTAVVKTVKRIRQTVKKELKAHAAKDFVDLASCTTDHHKYESKTCFEH